LVTSSFRVATNMTKQKSLRSDSRHTYRII
jgi:hypothetical protein